MRTIAVIPSTCAGIIAPAGTVAAGDDTLIGDGSYGAILDNHVIEPSRGTRVGGDLHDNAARSLRNNITIAGIHLAANIVHETIAHIQMVDRSVVARTKMNATPLAVAAGRVDDFKIIDFPKLLIGQHHGIRVAITVDQRQSSIGAVGAQDNRIAVRAGAARIHGARPTGTIFQQQEIAGRKSFGVDFGQRLPGRVGGRAAVGVISGNGIHKVGCCLNRQSQSQQNQQTE